jgi:vacuolar-type H+-ATPase subunit E/Vma4
MSEIQETIEALTSFEETLEEIRRQTSESIKRIRVDIETYIAHEKERLLKLADERAQELIDNAKKGAENQALAIKERSEKSIIELKKKIIANREKAIDFTISRVLGEDS